MVAASTVWSVVETGRQRPRLYVVRKGDSVERVARAFRVSEAALRQCNPQLTLCEELQAGQALRIPRPNEEPDISEETTQPLTLPLKR